MDACLDATQLEFALNIVAALNEGGFGDRVRVVRVNDWTTHWTYRDVVEVVEGAGANLDCLMLPKVQSAEQVVALDLLAGDSGPRSEVDLAQVLAQRRQEDAA